MLMIVETTYKSFKYNEIQMKKLYILFFLTILITGKALAQSHVVRGNVSDDEGGLPGVTVVELDQNERVIGGAITDFDGNYTIQLSTPNATVNFSMVGYATRSVQIDGRSIVNVLLEPAMQTMDEVVVTASRASSSLTNVSERDRTGSSVTVDMTEVQGLSVTSVGDALQGQVAGMDIMGSGSPGEGPNIVIRGLGSLAGSDPLIVVDGIIQRVSTSDIDLSTADTEDIGMLVSIAPEDIRSIRVLKDAAETAVWGSRGANGVLEITTLTGIRGPTKFEVNYRRSITTEAPTIPMLDGDEYVSMQLEMWHNSLGVFALPPEIANDRDFIDYYNYSQNTNWLKEITRIGDVEDLGFSFSGGGDKTSYFNSVNYQNTSGTVLNTSNRRLTTRTNLDYRISNQLSLNTQISYVNIYREDNWGGSGGVRRTAYTKSPNMAIYEHDEFGNVSDNFFNPIESYQGSGVTHYNPVAVASLSKNDREQNNFQTNFNLRFIPTQRLVLRQTVSFQFNNTKSMVFIPHNAIGARWLESQNNWMNESNSSMVSVSTRTTAHLTIFDDIMHHLSGTFMWETSSDNRESISSTSTSGPSIHINDPSAHALIGGIQSSSSTENDVGGLAQVLYKLYDKHIFNVNARLDANSKFGESFRWGLFPSISYGWRFSDEEFIKRLGVFDDSRIRMSWGQTGSSGVRSYDRHGFFAETNVSGRGSSYMNLPTLIPTRPELERLKWETGEQVNLGIDIAMLRNRLFVTFDIYNRQTKDVLWPNYNIPGATGYTRLLWYNEGGIRNRGWEISTNVVAMRSRDFDLSLNINMYHNENTFTTFPENLSTERNTDLQNGRFPVKAEVGTPVGSFFGLRYLGVYPTTEDAVALNPDGTIKHDANGNPIPMNFKGVYQFQGGDAMYLDLNNDGVIDINDVVYLGDSNPDLAGGFGINTRYKNISVRLDFLFRYGYQIVNEIAMDTESMNNRNNQSTAVLHRWRRPGQDFDGILPRAYLGNVANNLGSDRYVEDGDFLRLNNIAVNYTFRREQLRRFNIDMLRIAFTARKVYTFTNYSGQDPEVSTRVRDPFWFGTDSGIVPSPRVYSLNFTIGF